ncbi:hypothetical protein ACQRWP_28750 [Micromonospora trifolii]|uniref:hypothetical protein n=1 Tax=Micromonospora trifolii TaxID=2911208 RepID=UPI003D2F1041
MYEPGDGPGTPALGRHRSADGYRRVVGVHRAPGAGGPSRGYLLTVALLAGTASMPILAAISAGSATPGSTALPDSSTPFMPTPSVGPVVIPLPMTNQPPLTPLGTPSVGPTSGWLPAAPLRPREGPAADPGPARWTTAPPVAPRPTRSTLPPVPPPVAPPPPTDPDPTDPPDPDPTDPDPTDSPEPDPTDPDPTGSADPDPTPTLTADPTPTLDPTLGPTPTPPDDATATAVPTSTRSVPAPTPTPPAVPTQPVAVGRRLDAQRQAGAAGRTDVPCGVAGGTVTIRRGPSGDGGVRR